MSEKILTANELEAYEAIARQRGYPSLREYMRILIEKDAEAAVEDDDELPDPEESFRIAWGQAMRGEVITLEEFRRSMDDDDD